MDVVSSESYTAKINAAFQSLGYPLPDQMQEDPAAKKPVPALHKRTAPESAGMA